jgi:hypothetical protein
VTEETFFFFFDKTDCFTPIPCNPFSLSHNIFFVSSLCNSKKGGHQGQGNSRCQRGKKNCLFSRGGHPLDAPYRQVHRHSAYPKRFFQLKKCIYLLPSC